MRTEKIQFFSPNENLQTNKQHPRLIIKELVTIVLLDDFDL